jgi:3-oxoadipate enol-lactonase
MTTSRSCRVATKLGVIHVEERGQGPAVFCWPSLFADARTLDVVVDALAPDHRVVVVDPPGHGKSGAPTSAFSLADCAAAAMQILDELGIPRATWIGTAWGGHVGVAAALGHRHRVERLVVLNAPMAPWRGRRLALMRLSQALLALFGPRSFVARMIADKSIAPSAGPRRSEMVGAVEAALRRCDARGLRVAMASAMFGREDLGPRLAEVRVPSVFFAGADDELFPIELARQQAAAVPGSRFVVVQRSGHHSAIERPDVVLPILGDVMRGEEVQPQPAHTHTATSAM